MSRQDYFCTRYTSEHSPQPKTLSPWAHNGTAWGFSRYRPLSPVLHIGPFVLLVGPIVLSARPIRTPGTGPTARTGAQFEIRIDGTPHSYRDRKVYAMKAARLKARIRIA
jgi:hypothetical protein